MEETAIRIPTEIRGSMEMIEGSPRWGVKQEDSENIAMYSRRCSIRE